MQIKVYMIIFLSAWNISYTLCQYITNIKLDHVRIPYLLKIKLFSETVRVTSVISQFAHSNPTIKQWYIRTINYTQRLCIHQWVSHFHSVWSDTCELVTTILQFLMGQIASGSRVHYSQSYLTSWRIYGDITKCMRAMHEQELM